MLRQTNAERAQGAWLRLSPLAADVHELLALPEELLREILDPLGLVNQRVSAIRETAKALQFEFGGRVPRSPDRLLELPNIGVYSANAIACFAFGRRVAIVDGNILRVLSRLIGIEFGRDNRRNKDVWKFAESLLPSRGVREHNFGLLDFCADICRSKLPRHDVCPIRQHCSFYLREV